MRQNSRRHAVRRFVDQFASEILRLANDAAFLDSLLQRLLIAGCDHGDRLDRLVLAITLVSVGIKISYERAFNDGLDGGFCFDLFRNDEGQASQIARFQCAHGGPSNLSQFSSRKSFRFAAADQEQAFAFESGWLVQPRKFENLARHISRREQVSSRLLHSFVGRGYKSFRLIVLWTARLSLVTVFSTIEHDSNQAFSFNLSGRREGKCDLHDGNNSMKGMEGITQLRAISCWTFGFSFRGIYEEFCRSCYMLSSFAITRVMCI